MTLTSLFTTRMTSMGIASIKEGAGSKYTTFSLHADGVQPTGSQHKHTQQSRQICDPHI